jgi:glyoxylase-like metal-dependent hydrolase (beta-lactamase superfamily II)
MSVSSEDLLLSEVAAGVWELRLPIPWEDSHVNCFLFPEPSGPVDMIDCGIGSEESLALVWRAVEEVGGPGARLRRLVVTHIHPDHYGGAGEITGRGAELHLHKLEVPMVHPRYLEIEQLVTEVGDFLRLHGVPEKEARFLANASRWMREFVKPANPSLQLDGTELLHLGSRVLRVEWTPGHSPGHVCLFDPSDRLLFAGDQLLPDVSPNIGLHPQSTSNPLDDYLAGLRRLESLQPRLVLPAHGRPFTEVTERVGSLREHHSRRKEQMLSVLAEGETSGWEMAIAVWGLRSDLHDMRMALQEGLAHLQSLSREGLVEKWATPASISWRLPK